MGRAGAAVVSPAPAQSPAASPRPQSGIPASFGAPGQRQHAPGRVLVAPAAGKDPAALARVARALDASVQRRLPGTRVHQVRLPRTVGVEQAVRRFERDPAVAYAEPDFAVFPTGSPVTPNDPDFTRLYGLDNTGQTGGRADADIDAPEAWSSTVGSQHTIIAVIDTGIDLTHPDLRDNAWTNPGEVARNGIDDDGNGYVDDLHGWDFAHNDATVFDGAGDEHGTHVAGTIAATGGNGIGVTGVAWRARLMSLKFLGPDGGYTSDAIAAIGYAVANGAKISNNSWGGAGHSRSLEDAIAAAGRQGHLFVAAAGNGGADGIGDDLDTAPQYPAAYSVASLVSVAATDHTDALATFSNYGDDSVDLAAPGVRIHSTLPNRSYGAYSGTSMATPQVTGAAALLLSDNPRLDATGLKTALLGAVDPMLALHGRLATGGRLNIGRALAAPAEPVITLGATPPTVDYRSPTVLAGQITRDGQPLPQGEVLIEQRRVGTTNWTTAPAGSGLLTDASGRFAVPALTPSENTDYRARLLDPTHAGSLIRRVNVRAVLTNTTSTRGLTLGWSRVLSGALNPRHDGTVTLTILRNGNRIKRTTVKLVDSAYRYSYRPERRGTYTTHARWTGDVDHLGTRSPARTFRVR